MDVGATGMTRGRGVWQASKSVPMTKAPECIISANGTIGEVMEILTKKRRQRSEVFRR